MSTIWIEKRKPCGSVRQAWAAEVLGSDVWGDWFAVDGGVALLPLADPWVARFHADGSVRVDVATTILAAAPVSSFIDLDVDVERDTDGTVRMLDADDLLDRGPSYPRAWVDLAWEAWHDVERDLRARVEPFGAASDRWLRRATSAAPPHIGAISA